MKQKIKRFLKLRKQQDAVKIACILALAGTGFLTSLVYHAAYLYSYVNTPVEYVLTAESAISRERVDELVQMWDGVAVSRQKIMPVTIMYKGVMTTVDCVVLSKEYAGEVLGIDIKDGTKRFYMGEGAFSKWRRELEEGGNIGMGMDMAGSVQSGRDGELDVKYRTEEDAGSGISDGGGDMDGKGVSPTYKTAKVCLAKKSGLAEDLVFAVGDAKDLAGGVYSLRINFRKHDLDGIHVEKLKKQGYSLENEDAVITEGYELEIMLLHMRYGLLCLVICLASMGALIMAASHSICP